MKPDMFFLHFYDKSHSFSLSLSIHIKFCLNDLSVQLPLRGRKKSRFFHHHLFLDVVFFLPPITQTVCNGCLAGRLYIYRYRMANRAE